MRTLLITLLILIYNSVGLCQKYVVRDTADIKVTKILADSLANDSTISAKNGKLSIKDSSIVLQKINHVLLENQTASADSDSVHIDISSYNFSNPKAILTNKSNWHASVKSVSSSEIVLYVSPAGFGSEVKYDLLILE